MKKDKERQMTERDIEAAIAEAPGALHCDGELLTIYGANLAGRPCELHCSVCEGLDHHWMDACADEGDPVQVCKHCAAWRPYPDDEDEG